MGCEAVSYFCIMEKEGKHSEVIERYAGDLLLECCWATNEILDRAEDEDRQVTANERRELNLLLKFSLLLVGMVDLRMVGNSN